MAQTTCVTLSPEASLRGKVVCVRDSSKPVYAFLGIPFAAPPTGHLRFKPPQSLTMWSGERDATHFGPICPQNKFGLEKMIYPLEVPEMSEDCLYMNVWTPTKNADANLPVMVWIYGGAFIYGLSNVYDGTAMASYEDVLFVSFNYRIGPFGFLSTGDANAPGNVGLLDQIEALKFVQRHIKHFGGNPHNVTLFGESAGAISASILLTSKLSEGLFHKIIGQSGAALYPGVTWTGEQARKYIVGRTNRNRFKGTTNEDLVKYLRQLSTEEILEYGDGFSPTIDNYVIKDSLESMYQTGHFRNVDCVFGFNSHEGAQFLFDVSGATSVEDKKQARDILSLIIKKRFFRGCRKADDIIEAIVDKYHIDELSDSLKLTKALEEVYAYLIFVAPIHLQADIISRTCSIHMYHFEFRPSFSPWPDWVIADHGQEIMFVLGEPFIGRIPYEFNNEEKRISKALMKYWANFARNSNPNGHGLPCWNLYTKEEPWRLVLGTETKCQKDDLSDKLHFYNTVIKELARECPTSKY